MSVRYLSREDWGADPDLPRLGHEIDHAQLRGVVVHHTAFAMGDYDGDGYIAGDLDDIQAYMRRLQTIRPDLGLDVPYSYVCFKGASIHDAVVCEGRGRNRTGAHTKGYNSSRLGAAIAGNTSDDPVTPGVIEAVRWCGGLLADQNTLHDTLDHGAFKTTECAGVSARANLGRMQPPFARTQPINPISDEDGMTLLHDTDSGTWRVAVPGEGSAVIEYPDHWRKVIAAGRISGVYESEYMSDLIDKIRAERAAA